jgi:RNA polymerase sigma-70 factor (ECF subfamily)
MAESTLSEMFERSWRERLPGWRAYALRLTRDPADAEDVVLEATARTLQTQPELDSETRLHAYVITAIRHIAFELVRRKRQMTPLDEDRPGPHRRFASSALQLALSGECRRQRAELGAALHAELASLPEAQRQAVELMVLRTPPMKLREVAQLQGVTTSTVHYRLSKGLEILATRAGRSAAP